MKIVIFIAGILVGAVLFSAPGVKVMALEDPFYEVEKQNKEENRLQDIEERQEAQEIESSNMRLRQPC